MKKDFTKDFKEIQEMTDKIRSFSLIKESITFEDSFPEDEMGAESDEDAYAEGDLAKMDMDSDMSDEEKMMQTGDGADTINQIREIALKGMISLCKTPEDPKYQVLKKVFQLLDKAVDTKENENGKE